MAAQLSSILHLCTKTIVIKRMKQMKQFSLEPQRAVKTVYFTAGVIYFLKIKYSWLPTEEINSQKNWQDRSQKKDRIFPAVTACNPGGFPPPKTFQLSQACLHVTAVTSCGEKN